jgi:hypothetical protein
VFALVQQTFLAKNLAKSMLIPTLDKVIYYKGTLLQGSTKPLFTTQIGWRPVEKNSPFFQHASSSIQISMVWTSAS